MASKKTTAQDVAGATASIAIAQVPGLIGLSFTKRMRGMYPQLDKPDVAPPPWLFGPVWTALYALVGVAGWLVARAPTSDERDHALALHATHLGLNAIWTPLFATGRRRLALAEIVVLWGAIVASIRAFAKVSTAAAALLIPYLAWTSFALFLNASIVRKN